jgi:hypothetical protein
MSQIQKAWFADVRRNLVLSIDVDGNVALSTVLAAVSTARTKAILLGLSKQVTRQ